MNINEHLEDLMIHFENMNEKAYRILPKNGGIDTTTYIAGKDILNMYKLQKALHVEEKYVTINGLIDVYINNCDRLISESESNLNNSRLTIEYKALKAQANLIKTFLSYNEEKTKNDNEQIVQSIDMTEYELQSLYNSNNCPACGSNDIVIVRNLITNRYHACCYKCGGKFNMKSEFDSIINAIDVWNLCCKIVWEMSECEKK